MERLLSLLKLAGKGVMAYYTPTKTDDIEVAIEAANVSLSLLKSAIALRHRLNTNDDNAITRIVSRVAAREKEIDKLQETLDAMSTAAK